MSHLTDQPGLDGLGGNMLARYETGALATLLFFAFCLGTAVYGFVRIFHFAKTDGWIDVAMAPLLFIVFHNRFRRDDNDPRQ
jgi:hypothetical protein